MVLLVSYEDLLSRANGGPNGRDHQSYCPDANPYEESDSVVFCHINHFDYSRFRYDSSLFLG